SNAGPTTRTTVPQGAGVRNPSPFATSPALQLHIARFGNKVTLLGPAEGAQPNRSKRAGDPRPIHGDHLAQRVRVERLFGRAQDWVLGKHLTELLHPALKQAAGDLSSEIRREASPTALSPLTSCETDLTHEVQRPSIISGPGGSPATAP